VSAVLFDGWPFNALFDSTVTPPVAHGIPKLQRSLKSKLDEKKLLKMAQEAITAGSPARALDILEVTDAHSTRTVQLPIFLTPTAGGTEDRG
jgi:hypothetical protein